jgi:hypothetical protein
MFRKRFFTQVLVLLMIGLFVATQLAAAHTSLAPSPETGQASKNDKEEDPAVIARRELSRMPSSTAERIASIKDLRVRTLALRAYQLLKAIAENTDKQKEGSLITQFDQTYLNLVTAGGKGSYQACLSKCKSDTEKCQGACKAAGKKSCGCKLAGFGCFVAQCLF